MAKLGGETLRVTVYVNSEAEPELYEAINGTHRLRRSEKARILMDLGLSMTKAPAAGPTETAGKELKRMTAAASESVADSVLSPEDGETLARASMGEYLDDLLGRRSE